jgi:hypothetical protein
MEREAKDWRSVMITGDKAGYAHLHVCRAQPTTVILHLHAALQAVSRSEIVTSMVLSTFVVERVQDSSSLEQCGLIRAVLGVGKRSEDM